MRAIGDALLEECGSLHQQRDVDAKLRKIAKELKQHGLVSPSNRISALSAERHTQAGWSDPIERYP